MKRILLFATVAALALVSCKKEEQITPEIKANQTEYTIPLEGTEETTFYVEFTTNVDWTAAVKEDVEWISISPKKGVAGAGKIKIVAVANSDNDPRTAVLVVTAGTAQQEFTLTQQQQDAFSLVQSSAEIDRNGGTVEVKVMTNIDYTVTIPSDVTWITKADTKAYGEQTTVLTVTKSDEIGPRSAVVTVSADGFEEQTFTVSQTGRSSVAWIKKPATDWAGFTPANGAHLAVLGDNLLVGNADKVLVLNRADGTVSSTIDAPSGFSINSLCVDDAGNIIIAADAAYGEGNYLQIYKLKSLNEKPSLLMEYATANIWSNYMGNVRVKGDVDKNAVVSASVSLSQYWIAWQISDGVVNEPKRGAISDWGTIWGVSNMCVAPVSSSLDDGLWAVGYYSPYDLFRCKDVVSNTWEDAYEFNSVGNDNFNNISTLTVDEKNYVTVFQGSHFTYSQLILYFLENTSDGINELYSLNCTNQANWVNDENQDWTGAGAFTDACMTGHNGEIDIYYIDVNFGIAGCLKIM